MVFSGANKKTVSAGYDNQSDLRNKMAMLEECTFRIFIILLIYNYSFIF